MRLFREER